jgi:hypothetical protein
MSSQAGLTTMLEGGRANAVLSWALTGFVAVVAVESALRGQHLWGLFTAVVVALALVPPVAYRDPYVMLPWEVLALGALPILGRSLAQFALTSRLATHLSVAALALVVAVELDVFTPVRMTDWFAVLFVVIATMATAGVWAVVQWLSDVYLGTAYLLTGAPETEIEAMVMWDFVAATVAGVLAGVVFELYFRRRVRGERRLPDEVREVVE